MKIHIHKSVSNDDSIYISIHSKELTLRAAQQDYIQDIPFELNPSVIYMNGDAVKETQDLLKANSKRLNDTRAAYQKLVKGIALNTISKLKAVCDKYENSN